VGAAFYWLMQPTVVENRGLAGYQPPPKAVVSYVPWVPPDSSETDMVITPRRAPEAERSTVAAPKIDTRAQAQETRAPVRREQHVRARQAPTYNNNPFRSFAFRPFF
jgi:hypothetical protein